MGALVPIIVVSRLSFLILPSLPALKEGPCFGPSTDRSRYIMPRDNDVFGQQPITGFDPAVVKSQVDTPESLHEQGEPTLPMEKLPT